MIMRTSASEVFRDAQSAGAGYFRDPDTGRMWSLATCPGRIDWYAALAWADRMNLEGFLGFKDWRLPNVAELSHVKRRFPDRFPPGTAMIELGLPTAVPVGAACRTLRGPTTHGSGTRNAVTKTVCGLENAPQSQVQGADTQETAPWTPPAQNSEPVHCTRVYVCVPLVRAAAPGPAID
ncbi:MAG: DUF1566 domain-containing protein [Rhodobacteraceae bacterium]|nr:DUF1566 domain-containing protein [Paracoccaceae bacterium]